MRLSPRVWRRLLRSDARRGATAALCNRPWVRGFAVADHFPATPRHSHGSDCDRPGYPSPGIARSQRTLACVRAAFPMSRNEGIDRRDALWLARQTCLFALGHFDMREIGFLTDHACDGRSAQEIGLRPPNH